MTACESLSPSLILVVAINRSVHAILQWPDNTGDVAFPHDPQNQIEFPG